MIHDIGQEVAAELKTKACPIPVVDGPEPSNTVTWSRERIVIEDDPDENDTFAPPHTGFRNPHIRMICNIAARITIYAQEPRLGALVWEHRNRARHLLDLVMVALEKVIKARKNGWQVTGAKFITPEDLEGSEIPGGAAYQVKFTVERGVYEQKWDGSPKPQGTPGSVVSTGSVTIKDMPAVPAENPY